MIETFGRVQRRYERMYGAIREIKDIQALIPFRVDDETKWIIDVKERPRSFRADLAHFDKTPFEHHAYYWDDKLEMFVRCDDIYDDLGKEYKK